MPDCRDGASWTPLQRLKNDALWVLANLALAAARPLPAGVLRRLGRVVGVLAHAWARGARRTAVANVARVFPDLGDAARRSLVHDAFVSAGETLGDTVALLGAGVLSLELAPDARRVLDEARAEGRGVVFASAHLGPWENVAASLVAAGVPLVTIARESYDPRFTRLYERLRGAHGVRVVWRARAGAATGIVRTLRTGHVLGVPMDLASRVASCDAPFLGHPARTAVGPARIALRTGAAVVVGTAAPSIPRANGSPGPLVITATRIPTADLSDLPPPPGAALGPDETAARVLTARINAELSRRILALPHAWVWMHERWRDNGAKMDASEVAARRP